MREKRKEKKRDFYFFSRMRLKRKTVCECVLCIMYKHGSDNVFGKDVEHVPLEHAGGGELEPIMSHTLSA